VLELEALDETVELCTVELNVDVTSVEVTFAVVLACGVVGDGTNVLLLLPELVTMLVVVLRLVVLVRLVLLL